MTKYLKSSQSVAGFDSVGEIKKLKLKLKNKKALMTHMPNMLNSLIACFNL